MLQIAREQKPENSLHLTWTQKSPVREWVFPKLPGKWDRIIFEDQVSLIKPLTYCFRVSFFGAHTHQQHAQKIVEMYMQSLKESTLIDSFEITHTLPSKL